MNLDLFYEIINVAGHVMIIAGLIFMFFGVIGIFKYKDFYPRVLVTSKIDTVGMTTVFIGLVLRHGVSFFSGKILLIMVIMLILNPLVAHFMARSAHAAGHQSHDDLTLNGDDAEREGDL